MGQKYAKMAENGQKCPQIRKSKFFKNFQKPKIGKNGWKRSKMSKNSKIKIFQKFSKNVPKRSMGQKYDKMAENGQKCPQIRK